MINEKIRCGGSFCKSCKRCISPPRLRKNFQSEFWTICDECGPNVLRITFVPREESVKTDFVVAYQDIPKLIQLLKDGLLEHLKGPAS